jgi:lipoprotein-releasing system permease protein
MYKLLLCWRYLRTRYIALASIISVMLGVATLIVVNAVMAGFTHEMQDRIHGFLSDIVFESHSMDGFPDADARMAEIYAVAGDDIAGMSPTVHVPAMLSYSVNSQYMTRQVMVIGVDETTYGTVSDFGRFLQHPKNRKQLDFHLKEGGYDTIDHQATDPDKALPRVAMADAGWTWRKVLAERAPKVVVPDGTLDANPFARAGLNGSTDSAADGEVDEGVFDPAKEQHTGAVLGIGLCAYRGLDGGDQFRVIPGDDVKISYPMATKPPRVDSTPFTIVDVYDSKMSEYDSSFVFVPIRKLQEMRGMYDQAGSKKVYRSNAIQIRLKSGVDLEKVRDKLREKFNPQWYSISTWQDKEGALIAAVRMERLLLNILLFLIIAVAGFGILAIFFMIVFEKTRDIGILKSLGATGWGVLGIFLSYGFFLGSVGAGIGLVAGLLLVKYINEVADLVAFVTGQPVFDPSVYYFQEIPAIVEFWTVFIVVAGSLAIAIVASVLPAIRAASLHPVQALRYE